MREHRLGTGRGTAFWTLFLFAACEDVQTGVPTPMDMGAMDMGATDDSGITLPDCSPGQLITVGSDGTVSCVQPPQPMLLSSACQFTQALSAINGVLICVEKGNGSSSTELITAINNDTAAISNLQAQINQLSRSGTYVGLTAAAFSGRITSSGLVGLPAASALCSASFGANARMCSVYEIWKSVATGVITSAFSLPKAWVYMDSWQNFSTTAVEPTSGLNDNCGSYTYSGTANGWYGTAMSWENDAPGDRVLKFFTGPDQMGIGTPMGNYPGAPCNATLPIACCK